VQQSKQAFNTDFAEKKIKPQIYTEERPCNMGTIVHAFSEYFNILCANPWLNLLLGEISVKRLLA
jgi:hypothetical protein